LGTLSQTRRSEHDETKQESPSHRQSYGQRRVDWMAKFIPLHDSPFLKKMRLCGSAIRLS